MKLKPAPTPTIIGPSSGGSVSLRPVFGTGPKGDKGLPGPGAAAWTGNTVVGVDDVRQAPDGSWIKSTASRTTRLSFDATEQTFWAAVLASTATIEKIAVDAAIDAKVPAASTTVVGKVELATTAETQTGTDATRAVTPASGAATYQPLDSDLTAIAALATTNYGRAFLALADQAALMALVQAADATTQGKVELATTTETQTGTDATRAVTPAGGAATYQPLDADLSAIAALASAADKMPYSTGAQAWALATLTSFARTLLDDTNAAGGRATLGAAASTLGGAETKATASGTSGTVTLDCSAASVFSVAPSGNITTLTLSNVPASGTACTITLIVNQGATPRTVATPTGGVFLGAPTPTQVANKMCVFTYLTVDGGTTWACSAAVQV